MPSLPSDHAGILKRGQELIEICRVSQGRRAAYYRALAMIADTGRQDGGKALINMMYRHLDRVASHLFSPTELQFTVDFDEDYPQDILSRGQRAGRLLTRRWQRSSTDMVFGLGVFESLKYGAVFLKQWPSMESPTRIKHNRGLVMPWQFGVFREDNNDIHQHPALCETFMLTMPEVWNRIWHLPNADQLFKRIGSHATEGAADDDMNSFFHNVMSTSQINTGLQAASRPVSGGIVQVTSQPNQMTFGPQVAAKLVKMHELWVWDEDDYTTIQIIEPDILVAPLLRKANLLISAPNVPEVTHGPQPEADHSQLHPYTLIQPNMVHGFLWGRSELADLIEPQDTLTGFADDQKRLIGLQIDKILAFQGDDGITDEAYGAMRLAGYVKSSPGSTVSDLTPPFPAQLPEIIQQQIKIIEMLGSMEGIMAGRGDPGVRAGSMQQNLMKTASPGLRDRSLLVERQCAEAADLWLSVMEAKDPARYWSDGRTAESRENTAFFLSELPEDRFVSVDSHSSSPIFADDHQQLVAFGIKAGILGPEDALEMLPFPNKDLALTRLKQREEAKQKMLAELMKKDPEALEKIMGGHKPRK